MTVDVLVLQFCNFLWLFVYTIDFSFIDISYAVENIAVTFVRRYEDKNTHFRRSVL